MKKINSEKGITLIILMITIVIIAILTAVTITHVDTGKDIKDYNYMSADIELLESKILIYYNKKNSIPTDGDAFNAKETLGDQASDKDNDNYYVIDLEEISNVTLNYGGGTTTDRNVYIINEKTHNVYYLKGVIFDGERYYTKF